MKKNLGSMSIITMFVLFFAVGSFAQPGMMWRGGGGWGKGGRYCMMYDPQTVETISGEVASVERFTPMMGMSHGSQLLVKTDKETIAVHLGPAWYLENQDIEFAPKDKVEIKGSRVTFGGKSTIIASEVKKGDITLKLWHESGYPLWSGCVSGCVWR